MNSESSKSFDELQNYCQELEEYCESLKDTIRLICQEFHKVESGFLNYQRTMQEYWAAQEDIEGAEQLQLKARQKQDEMFVGFLHADIDRQARDALTRTKGGARSAESRRKKRNDDLELAARTLRNLETRYPVKKYKLQDIANETGLDLSRLQKLTKREIKKVSRSL